MTTRRLLTAALAVLLLAALVGPSGAAEQTATQSRTVTKVITIPAGAFSATDETTDFNNSGSVLAVNSGQGLFAAPLFLESREVTVNSITLYAYDNNGAGDVCVTLFRTTPWNGADQNMGFVCSTGTSATDPRVFTETGLAIRQITGSYGPYLWLYLPWDTGMRFYAVRINYSYGTAS